MADEKSADESSPGRAEEEEITKPFWELCVWVVIQDGTKGGEIEGPPSDFCLAPEPFTSLGGNSVAGGVNGGG